jgi:hypothetical protein
VGEKRNAYKIFVGEPEGNKTLGKSRSRCEDNIKMYLTETVWESVNLIHLAHDRD